MSTLTTRTFTWPAPPELVDADRLLWAETVHDGGCASVVVAPGSTVRLTDLDGDAWAHVLVYDAEQPEIGTADATAMRAPEPASLTTGCRLVSARGRPLATITHSSAGRRRTAVGAADLAVFERAVTKHGLARRPVPPRLSFFRADERQLPRADERLLPRADERQWPAEGGGSPGSGPGASVSIRAEVSLIVLVANTTRPSRPGPGSTCGPLELLAWRDYWTSPGQPSRPRIG